MNLLITFILLSIFNVILQTVKSIATIRCGKQVAALINAVAYGLYTFVIIYTNCELNIWLKAGIVAFVNYIGVYAVKVVEEKMRKDKLWKIECTVNNGVADNVEALLCNANVPYSYTNIVPYKYKLFNIYCETQKESFAVKQIIEKFDIKYFVSESKAL